MGPWNTILKDGKVDLMHMIDCDMAQAGPAPHDRLATVAGLWGYNSQVMGAFLAGYGLSVERLQSIEEHVKQMTVLSAMESFRWEQEHQPHNIPEYAESVHFIAHDLFDL